MTRWRAVIFDLDDTLYAERDYVLSGMRSVALFIEKKLGIAAETAYQELSGLFAAGIRGKIFDEWLNARSLSSHLVPEFVRVYRTHVPTIVPFPGTIELLEQLSGRCNLAMLSDGYWDVQQLKLQALGLAKYFNVVLFTDSLGRDSWKPSQTPFLFVLQKLGVKAEEAVYVGDNPIKDFRGAKQLRMCTLRMRHPVGLHYSVEPASELDAPDLDLNDWQELPRVLMDNLLT